MRALPPGPGPQRAGRPAPLPGVPVPGVPRPDTPLSRGERRAARRAVRRAAGPGAGRPASSRLVGPMARGAVLAVTAGLVVGGDLGTAEAAGGYGGVAGTIARSTVERTTAAQAARLSGAARSAAEAARVESLAVATAALAASAAVAPLTAQLDDAALRADLASAAERLSGLVGAARSPGARVAADVPVPPARPAEHLAPDALTRALETTAGEVFRLSMRVETLSGATEQDESVIRVASVDGLEQAVTEADAVAAELGELEPLTPLTDEEKALRAAEEAGLDGTATPAHSHTRLRGDTPAGVEALMERWRNGEVPAEALCPVPFAPGHLLQCDAAAALAGLNVPYREAFGRDLAVVSTYRELETQVSLRAAKGGLAAVPGTSNHGWGIAVDLGGIGGLGEFDEPGYLWLKDHAAAYGWYHPEAMEPGGGGPPEPWHWEFGTA